MRFDGQLAAYPHMRIRHTATQVYVSTKQRAAAVEHEARTAAAVELEQQQQS